MDESLSLEYPLTPEVFVHCVYIKLLNSINVRANMVDRSDLMMTWERGCYTTTTRCLQVPLVYVNAADVDVI